MAASRLSVETVERPELAKHDSSVLDLAFAMDCTGSMASYIKQAQQNIRTIVEEIVAKESSDIQMALVEYRDHPPQDESFVTRVNDFTPSVAKMKKCLDASSASGGGDTPEAVADALQQVLKLNWRKEATKICVFIADAPPHGLGGSGDGFPNGCPLGLDPMQIVRDMVEKDITIYMVGCEPSINPYRDFFMAIAHITGGQYVPLGNAKLLAKVIIGGAQEEISLQQLMQEVNAEVMAEAAANGGEIDEDEMTTKVHNILSTRGAKTKQLRMNASSLPEASTYAKKMSYCTNMADLKTEWTSERFHGEPEPTSRFSSSKRMKSKKKSAPTSDGGGGGMLSGMRNWFGMGSGSKKTSEPDELNVAAVSDEVMDCAEDENVEAPDAVPEVQSYSVAEENIDIAQSKRMVERAMWKNKLKK